MKYNEALKSVQIELAQATRNHRKFNSYHEGLAILQEEFEELKAEVYRPPYARTIEALRLEAKQTAAMALRFMIDLT